MRQPLTRGLLVCTATLASAALLAGCATELELSDTQKRACTVAVDGTWIETADDEVDVEHRRIFDAEGRISRVENHTTYHPLTEDVSTVYLDGYTDYFYDTEGQRVREEVWQVGDVLPSEEKRYVYDDEGRILRVDAGSESYYAEYTYGEFGVVEKTEARGATQSREQYHYDEKGLLVRTAVYNDGILFVTIQLTRDEGGRVDTSFRDYLGEVPSQSLEAYSYNERGDLEAARLDSGADGTIDSITEYVYDESGNLLSKATDCDMDGIVDWQDSYTYDGHGRLLSSAKQREEHEMLVTIETSYDYSCHEL